ncbi:MAG: tetratricopeptide repeat protein, partial [Verrucomicrobia bacterium]|nr:tetratricopeptide repeat protein [Verrucomicrobiota bacterium]
MYTKRYLVAGIFLGISSLIFAAVWKLAVSSERRPATSNQEGAVSTGVNTASAIALAPHQGDEPIDREIRQLQDEIRAGKQRLETMKRLGWAFVRKARLSCDPGYYKLAEQCALSLESENPKDPDALLLHGHIFDSLHKFREAESVARKLVTLRNQAPDYGLLGDVLMEQGRLQQAIEPYQKMINLRPDLEGYLRIAHVRWLKGDLEGAQEIMEIAVTGGSPREPESTAWAYTRRGSYELQAGKFEAASRSADTALGYVETYPAALLLKARVLTASGNVEASIPLLQDAARRTMLPEYQWALADTLREAGKTSDAEVVERDLLNSGAINDPRTFAIYLGTRSQHLEKALALAQAELTNRMDVFTLDAMAWALKANGRLAESRDYSQKSLQEGTCDGRLFYHAGSIALASGNYQDARTWFKRA